jgi:GDP-L-fucose synthase
VPRLFISGGNGMVGRNLLEHPAIVRWDVAAPRRGELDLTDRIATFNFLNQFKPDMVIHCAGKVGGIQANIAEPVAFLLENVELGRNVIEGARRASVRQFLNLSSSCIYPRNGVNPLREECLLTGELEPTNEGYALAKIFALRLCEYIRRETPEFLYKTAIPCNLYGRHDSFSIHRSHLVAAAIDKVHRAKLDGIAEVVIWGDGSARREFMLAADLADFVMKAVENFEGLPDVINVGVGIDHSINEYYEQVASVVGWRGRFVHDPTRPVGMKQKLLDVSRQTAWRWKPPTPLIKGLESTYKYYLEEYDQ